MPRYETIQALNVPICIFAIETNPLVFQVLSNKNGKSNGENNNNNNTHTISSQNSNS
jgi:hypothetical protein